jgi:asparagine synthase (glutamine-hydrolysing)
MVYALHSRGPDSNGIAKVKNCVIGHTRLAIIDLTESANQPMQSPDGRYTLTFNGEIYNFKELKAELQSAYQASFKAESDTEVLLQGLIFEGVSFIEKINGFFAFGFLDSLSGELILGRDRFGIKPLYYSDSPQNFSFASSIAALEKAHSKLEINPQSLSSYLQLSYIPAPHSIYEGVQKLEPGNYLIINDHGIKIARYYEPSSKGINSTHLSEDDIVNTFRELLRKSVQRRMISDVPVGTFLSGGFDSSIITKLASDEVKGIPSFSIGFPDHPFFDESQKAADIAKYLGVEHHIIELSESEIEEKLISVLDDLDEPFADSSAVLVNLLSEYARRYVTVALSGDGADELLAGYNKHRALYRSMEKTLVNSSLRLTSPLLQAVPEARNQKTLNKLRKIKKYSRGLHLELNERYLEWARFTPLNKVKELLINPNDGLPLDFKIEASNFNSVLKADMDLVLSNDMLTKVDVMSMSKSLEVRVPFLDHELVDFLFSVDSKYKITRSKGKILLRKAFESDFPGGFFNSKKRGFEAPLSHWFRGPLSDIRAKYFDKEFIRKQGLFNYHEIKLLEKKAISRNSGDSPHTLWALLVFQHWYSRNKH